MKTRQQAIARILREVADRVENLSDEDLDAVCRSAIQVTFAEKTVADKRDSPNENSRNSPPSMEIQRVAEWLRQSSDRPAATLILDEHCPSKDRLIELARHLDVSAQKRDTVDRLRMKIIEATVGFRLRSQAIQGSKAG